MMRGSVVGSGSIHLLVLAALFAVRHPASVIVPGPDVVQVALVDPGAITAPAPAPAELPEAKLTEIQPVPEEGVKLKPKKPAKQKPQQSRPPATAAAALPSAAIGNAGLKGDVAVDAANFEFTYYLLLVRNKVASNWNPPAGLAGAGQPVRAVVHFRIGRGGEVTGARLETGSGAEFFDRSALRAVILSDPLPPLPLGFPGSDLGVHFGFEWESP